MNINVPLHSSIHLWGIIALIVAGYIVVVINRAYMIKRCKNNIITIIVLASVYILYLSFYSYLCFFYRTQMPESHIQLEPFWSYKEAFNGTDIVRLGVARSILLNILITIPLGYLLPAVYRYTNHRYMYTFLTILPSVWL